MDQVKLVFLALSVAAIAAGSVSASAQTGGPIVRVQKGNGFGCKPPAVWVSEGGKVICKGQEAPPPSPPIVPIIPSGPPLVAQPIILYSNIGATANVGQVIRITGNSTSITLENLYPLPPVANLNQAESGLCTLTIGQTCHWGRPNGQTAADVFSSCALTNGSWASGSFYSATLNGDKSISLTVVSIYRPGINASDGGLMINNGTVPANYSSGTFQLPLDSFNISGTGAGGRCWPQSGESG